MFQPVPSTIRVEPVYRYDSQVVENVLHYKYEVPVNEDELAEFAEEWYQLWNSNVRAWQPTNVILDKIKVTDLSSEFAPGIEYAAGMPTAGLLTGVGLPNNVTVAVRYVTALRGRSYRGRSFHIGVRNTDTTLNQITTTFQSGLDAAYTAMLNVSTTQLYVQTVVSRYQGGALRLEGVSTPITAVTVDRTIDSQRRRLPGRGS